MRKKKTSPISRTELGIESLEQREVLTSLMGMEGLPPRAMVALHLIAHFGAADPGGADGVSADYGGGLEDGDDGDSNDGGDSVDGGNGGDSVGGG